MTSIASMSYSSNTQVLKPLLHKLFHGKIPCFAFVAIVSITLTNSRVYIDAANVTDSNDPIVVSNIAGAIASVLAP